MTRSTSAAEYAREWGLVFEREGMPAIAGSIWGWLLVCDPMEQTQDELAAALGVAKGSVSTNARLLERGGIVERVPSRSGRAARYRIRADAYESMMKDKLAATITMRSLADRGLKLARQGAGFKTGRLAELRRFYSFMEREQVAMLDRWRKTAGD